MSVRATAKDVRISPRKVGEVVALVRGRTTDDALTILEHTPRRAAHHVSKVINSAVANAENNHNYQSGSLFVSEIHVGPGIRMKRYQPAAHGRALPYQKVSSNITVIVEGKKKAPKKKPAAKKDTKSSEKKESTKTDMKSESKKEDK